MLNSAAQLVPLNPLTCPLNGVQLIEASAGTGKTYTITSLYLRLILGVGYSALSPEQILVVTFTNAATDELRGRIRKRLRQAELYLMAVQQGNALPADDFMDALLPDHTQHGDALRRLRDAQLLMDNAAIYTIHGFCQRVLSQYAFESGQSFAHEFVLSDHELTALAVRDVWRQKIYALQGEYLTCWLDSYASPDVLHFAMQNLLNRAELEIISLPDTGNFDAASLDLAAAHQALQSLPDICTELAVLFNELPGTNGTFMNSLQGRLNALQKVLLNCHALDNKLSGKTYAEQLDNFCPDKIAAKSVKKGFAPPQHRAFALIENLLSAWQAYQASQKAWVQNYFVSLVADVRNRRSALKQQQNVISSNDLLTTLANVLSLQSGQPLARQLRLQFPLAMVDEFQDTDAEQYQIFKSLYAAQAGHGLFMIGDPKQAIYKFRGADINTYLQAAADATARYTLDTNYRSTAPLVDACNWLFSRTADVFAAQQKINYQQVNAGNKSVLPLCSAGKTVAALNWLEVKFDAANKQNAMLAMAQRCAQHISTLLNADSTIGVKKLTAGDIAVLVRNRHEAAVLQTELALRNLRAVFLSNDSVFHSEEAQALYGLMEAVLNNHESAFKNALAAPVWAYSLAEIQHMGSDEREWEKMLLLFSDLQQLWLKKGLMAMVMAFIHNTGRPARWLQNETGPGSSGERRLTNMLHLAELLQDTSQKVHGREGLLSWFARHISQGIEHDQAQLRLESEADLIQIITLHRSKGLQYPVVYMPFTCLWSSVKENIYYDQTKQRLVADLSSDGTPAQAVQEARAEDLRIFYVGITRAESACFIGMADHKDINNVALGHLMDLQGQSLTAYLAANTSAERVFDAAPAETGCTAFNAASAHNIQALRARSYQGAAIKTWRLGSFSALSQGAHGDTVFSARHDETNPQAAVVITQNVLAEESPPLSRFTFPRGSHVGNALHSIFEELDFTTGLSQENQQVILQQLLSAGLISSAEADEDLLQVCNTWLMDCLQTPLTAQGIKLADINAKQKLVEMEFYFPVHDLNPAALNALLHEYAFVPDAAPLDFKSLNGMMKGFIDLIFCADGQYFVLDYKSNYLGDCPAAYQSEHMAKAMAAHRYDFQLVLYTLALHRYLRHRLPAYDYDRHIGGGLYLFLRGMQGAADQTRSGVFFHKPAKELIEKLDALVQGK